MSVIKKGFGGAEKPGSSEASHPKNDDNDTGGDRSAGFDLTAPAAHAAGNGAPDQKAPSHFASLSSHHAAHDDDSHSAGIVPRERLGPSPLPQLHAVNEAYHHIIDGDSDALDLARYWRVVRRHKWGIVGVALAVLAVGLLGAMLTTPLYRAQTTLVAEPFQRKVTLKDEYINSAAIFLFYDTQFDIIRSRAIAERVVDRLGLVEGARAELDKAPHDDVESDSDIAVLLESLRHWFDWRNWAGGSQDDIQAKPPSDKELRGSLVAEVQDSLTVQGGKQSQIINIFYEGPDAREAARRANAIAQAYVSFGDDNRLASSKRTNQWLQDQIVQVRENLKRSEAALLAYQESSGLVDTGQQQTVSNDRLMQMTDELVRAASQAAEAKLRYDQARLLAKDIGNIEKITTVLPNSNIAQIALDLSEAERQVGELTARVTDQHPMMKEALVSVREAKKALKKEIDKVVNTLRNEYQVADKKMREIDVLLASERAAIGDATGATLELVGLERDVENNRKLYEALLVRLQETDVTSDLDASNIQILDTATPPLAPFKPNKVLIVMLAGIFGLGLGILLAFVREHLDRTLKTLDDIEDKLGLPALGIVPLIKDLRDGTPETFYLNNSRSPFAEKLNHIRTSLLFSSIDNPPRTLLVTSATSGEGKTTLAANVAAALSQLDKTLLIEVDLRKPVLAARLGLTGPRGITDLVTDLGLANEVIRPIEGEPNLFVIPCGTRPPNPLELLSSQQFRKVLDRLREHFAYIVLDGPPLLAVSDAAVLGHTVDASIIAARAESTSIKMHKDALRLLRKAKVEPEGVVLTQADVKRMAYYGGHDYHYDRRYYGEDQATEKARL